MNYKRERLTTKPLKCYSKEKCEATGFTLFRTSRNTLHKANSLPSTTGKCTACVRACQLRGILTKRGNGLLQNKLKKKNTWLNFKHLLVLPEAWKRCLFPCRPLCVFHRLASFCWTGHQGSLQIKKAFSAHFDRKRYICYLADEADLSTNTGVTYSQWNRRTQLCIWVWAWNPL